MSKAKVQECERVFSFQGTTLADPGSHLSPEEVRDFYSASCPELTGAAVKGPKPEGNKRVFSFEVKLGNKG